MSWSGDFQIKYKGEHPKEFHKLAKMIIPNSIVRFDFDNSEMNSNSVELACTRNLSWYSADEDMKKLISYMPDGDSISMEVDGEGDYEEIDITKENGVINFHNSNTESERYGSDGIGIPEMLYESLSPRYADEPEEIDICSLDGYIQFIANTFAGDEQLMPIVQSFMYEVLDKDKINSFAWGEEDKILQEDCDKLDQLRGKFASIESTSQFLIEHKNEAMTFNSGEKQSVDDLPDWAQKYPKSVISSLGGANLLKQLIATKGEEQARRVVEMLGGGIMAEMSMDNDDYDNDYDDTQSFGGFRR